MTLWLLSPVSVIIVLIKLLYTDSLTGHSNVPPYGSLQLYNGAGSAGSLYLFDGSVTATVFRPVCDAEFGASEAQVACRQLGYQDVDNAVAYSNA